MSIPRVIHMLWLQGWDAAPPLAKLCAERWRALNPEFELRLYDRSDLGALREVFPITLEKLTPQALSDVFRAFVLVQEGGVWTDASTLPTTPLESWSDPAQQTGFLAFSGSRADRIIDSWFLMAEPQSAIMAAWWQEILRYWQPVPGPMSLLLGAERRSAHDFRRLIKWNLIRTPASGADYVSPNAAWPWNRLYPYFWFHYLFDHTLQTNPEATARFADVPLLSTVQAHFVAYHLKSNPDAPLSDFVEGVKGSHVQKLRFKQSLSKDRLLEIAQAIVASQKE